VAVLVATIITVTRQPFAVMEEVVGKEEDEDRMTLQVSCSSIINSYRTRLAEWLGKQNEDDLDNPELDTLLLKVLLLPFNF
jgi:hypothetical protein